jgi:hypothetical protein
MIENQSWRSHLSIDKASATAGFYASAIFQTKQNDYEFIACKGFGMKTEFELSALTESS